MFRISLLNQTVLPGVLFNDKLKFRENISQSCRICYYHIRELRRIGRYMPLFTALVISKLVYCNSLFHNIGIKDITKLQRFQTCKGSNKVSKFYSL